MASPRKETWWASKTRPTLQEARRGEVLRGSVPDHRIGLEAAAAPAGALDGQGGAVAGAGVEVEERPAPRLLRPARDGEQAGRLPRGQRDVESIQGQGEPLAGGLHVRFLAGPAAEDRLQPLLLG